MSIVVSCGHICMCDCHTRVEKKYLGGLKTETLIEPGYTMHGVSCCDICSQCRSKIMTGMMKPHLMECHGKTELEAADLIAAPYHSKPSQSFLDSFSE